MNKSMEERLSIVAQKVDTNEIKLIGLDHHIDRTDEKLDKILKHISSYDNRDNWIIKDLSDRLEKLYKIFEHNKTVQTSVIADLSNHINDSNRGIHDNKDTSSKHARYMGETRDSLDAISTLVYKLELVIETNKRLLDTGFLHKTQREAVEREVGRDLREWEDDE